MNNDTRITALAQDIYLARHNQQNSATGTDLTAFLDQTIGWVNQLIPEIQQAQNPQGDTVDWNFVRTNDDTIGTVSTGTTISYPLPSSIRKLVYNPFRDVTIRQDGTVISSFTLVNPNQIFDPRDKSINDRATVLQSQLIFSRPLNQTEIGGTITADSIQFIPQLSHTDVSLLDILDVELDIRQLFVLGVLKNQMLPDIVQGGLTPSYAQKFDDLMSKCIAQNNISSDSSYADRDDFGWIGGVDF